MEDISHVVIGKIGLKRLLSFFGHQENLTITELGDTWHPADGFVDESYFLEVKTIADLLALDYDFRGLVTFQGQVRNVKICYDMDSDQFTLTGNNKEIEKLKNLFEVRN